MICKYFLITILGCQQRNQQLPNAILDKYDIIGLVNKMKKSILILILIFSVLLATGCSVSEEKTQIAATTLPVYEFTLRICQNTDLSVTQIVTENVSCLHDYTLKVSQMKIIESADMVIINGAGLESFLDDALVGAKVVVDSSKGISLHTAASHSHDHEHDNNHDHDNDSHIWLSPENAKVMATNICTELTRHYPQYEADFNRNLQDLLRDLNVLQSYGDEKLSTLSCRELITFHDGFHYLADSFDLHIVRSVEEESGSEASAGELIDLIKEVEHHKLPAIFTEVNGSVSAANIISAETDTPIYTLDMAMAGSSYFDAMYHNINTLWEALQ